MDKTTILALLFLLLAGIAGGCIDELVPVEEQAGPNLSTYEMEVFLNQSANTTIIENTTTFYLSENATTKVVRMVNNTSIITIIPIETIGNSNQEPLEDIIIVANYSNITDASVETFTKFSQATNASNITYELREDVNFGQKKVFLEFDAPITGFVAYTIPQQTGQNFMHTQTSRNIIRFVLPEGHTTGIRAMGTPRPEPDTTYKDEKGRENIVWYGVEEEKDVSVKYYSDTAPRSLMIVSAILLLGIAIVLADYYRTRQSLRKKRELVEESAKTKRK